MRSNLRLSIQEAISRTILGRSLRVLSPDDRRKLGIVTLIQVSLSFLDLLGVAAIGLLGALSVSGLQSLNPDNRIVGVLRFLHIQNETFQHQAFVIAILAGSLLVGRTLLSIFFTRRILFFMTNRGAKISSDLVARLLAQPLLVVQARTTQETLFAITSGVQMIVLQVLAASAVLASDISLLTVMSVGLFVIDASTAIGTVSVFGLVALFLHRNMHTRAGVIGAELSSVTITSNEKIVEVLSSYRESIVRNRRDFYAREIGKTRLILADKQAEASFMPFISKYVLESTIVLGSLVIGGVQFIFNDTAHAVSTLAIFLAAGTRVAPAVFRVQQGVIQIRQGFASASPTLELIETLGERSLDENMIDTVDTIHEGFTPKISAKKVSLTYPNGLEPAVNQVSLEIDAGALIAFVGPSGAGKTTLIDILLGVLSPNHGTVSISGLPPRDSITKWPGAMAYVPQDVLIVSGSIRENVALGYPVDAATDELVLNAINVAQLQQFVAESPLGLDTEVGERGFMLSGGQRQRLGIARAIFTKPKLLVLDEATSALDAETEASISSAISELRGSTTIIMIAHRLSTVRNADLVVYLDAGRVAVTGSFEEVRKAVPNFERQAKLMGL
jgi:ABC-type multidrug transport system fused ATPase/permease subunit